MPGRELPARATPVTPAEVYLALRLQLQAQLGAEQTTRAGAMVLLGQMALETGRFRASMNYNLGGVKCGPQWPGCWQHFTTHETYSRSHAQELIEHCPPGASVRIVKDLGEDVEVEIAGKHPDNKFRAFEDLDAAVAAHVRFLLGQRYRKAVLLAMGGNADAYARALRTAGYYTGSADDYAKNVRQLAKEYDADLPADPPTKAPERLENEPLTLAATVAPPDAPEARKEAPASPVPASPVAPPVATAEPLPRIGEPLEVRVPWWLRLFGLLIRLFARRTMP